MQKYKNTLIYYNIYTDFNRFCNEKSANGPQKKDNSAYYPFLLYAC